MWGPTKRGPTKMCGTHNMWVPGPTIVGPGAHGKSLVEADLPIGAVSMSPNRKIGLDI